MNRDQRFHHLPLRGSPSQTPSRKRSPLNRAPLPVSRSRNPASDAQGPRPWRSHAWPPVLGSRSPSPSARGTCYPHPMRHALLIPAFPHLPRPVPPPHRKTQFTLGQDPLRSTAARCTLGVCSPTKRPSRRLASHARYFPPISPATDSNYISDDCISVHQGPPGQPGYNFNTSTPSTTLSSLTHPPVRVFSAMPHPRQAARKPLLVENGMPPRTMPVGTVIQAENHPQSRYGSATKSTTGTSRSGAN